MVASNTIQPKDINLSEVPIGINLGLRLVMHIIFILITPCSNPLFPVRIHLPLLVFLHSFIQVFHATFHLSVMLEYIRLKI